MERSRGFVSVAWGKPINVGIYAPSSWLLVTYERFLDDLWNNLVSFLKYPLLVLGDFKAKSTL